jgi:hypothetical protein
MRYTEVLDYPRGHDSTRFPFVAHVVTDARQFGKFERLAEDQTYLKILGHDMADGDGQIVIYVGCATEDVKRRVEAEWG